jgi:hypothetical protein
VNLEAVAIRTINDAFDPVAIDSFLESMNRRGAHVASIREAASDLNASPFGALQEISTLSFWDAYQKLDPDARCRVDAHYKEKVETVSRKLRSKYAKAFRPLAKAQGNSCSHSDSTSLSAPRAVSRKR